MAWITRWKFGRTKPLDSRFLRMGRYSDAYKTAEQRAAWERAVSWFSRGKHLRSFQHVLQHLYDPLEQNLHWIADRDGTISFELLQGSRKISGECSSETCEGITTLGVADKPSEALLHTLLEINYTLHDCVYAIEDGGRIVLRFIFPASEAEPDRVVRALRELALESDRMDDLLANRFSGIRPVVEPHVRNYTAEEINLRVEWFRFKVKRLIEWYRQDQSLHEEFPVGFSFVLLDTLFKIEFLLTPQGILREGLDQILYLYTSRRNMAVHAKNSQAIGMLEEMTAYSDTVLAREFYDVTATFSKLELASPGRWSLLLRPVLDQWDVYARSPTMCYVQYIPGYIMGYCLYKYDFPGFGRDLVALYYLLTEPEWAKGVGCPPIGFQGGKAPDKRAVLKTLRSLEDEWKDRFHVTDFHPENLVYSDELQFGKSWLQMMSDLKLERI